METLRQFEVESLVQDSDSDSEEIFFGPITKREIKSKLKHYNLYNDELLGPLQKLQDNDVLDDSLIKYYEDVFPKGSNEDVSWTSRCAATDKNQDVEDLDSDNLESAASTGLYKDSLDLTESLTESQLLQKYALNTTEQSSMENIEIDNQHSINIQELKIDVRKSENTTEDSKNNLKSQILNLSTDPISISINSTPEKSESFSLQSSPERSEYSYSKSDNSGFNCTLEDMEMLLKYGENYMTENKSLNSIKKDEVEIKDKENKSPICTQKTTHNTLNLDKKSPFRNMENQFLTPKSTSQPHRTFKQNATPSPFKLPSKILTRKSPNYKNIISPIAMYIKSTPTVPLMQNINKKPIQINTFRDTSSTEKDISNEATLGAAVGVLPVRSYKPASKTALLSEEEEPVLPNSIKKHMKCSTPQVIKHVGRVQVHQVPERCVHTQELNKQDDMTILSNSQSSIIEGDVSVYVSKNAARTNRLLHS